MGGGVDPSAVVDVARRVLPPSSIDPLTAVGQDAAVLRGPVLRLCASGALAGALVGAGDFAVGASRIPGFVTPGQGAATLAFFLGLYALSGALAGMLLGIIALALSHTDLVGGDTPGDRVAAHGVIGLVALAGVGLVTRVLVERYLTFFHHRQLIAVLTGATVAGCVLVALLLMLTLAGPLSKGLPFGPRLRRGLRAPDYAGPALVLGGYAIAALVGADLVYLQTKPRMAPAVRALNAALAAPALALLGALLAYGAYRALGERPRRATTARVLWPTALTWLLPLAIGCAFTWTTVRQLDLRPFIAAGAILLLTVALAPRMRAPMLVLPILAAFALPLGGRVAVRKSVALTGLGPHLTRAVQLASDLDRDGYSSLLGGGDCNDLDAHIHPGAFDWPDDGLDQDCNGHEATLAGASDRLWVEVPDAVPTKPNVLLLTLDALRADHVSAYGYGRPTTPNLDALAKEGALFQNAWAHAPSTRYSVPAILIGRYPSTIAVNNDPRVHWPPQVLPENRLMSEILKDQGYRTAATLTYHYFERGWGLDQGFDDYDYHLYTLHTVAGDPSATSGSSAKQLADLDIEWLRKHHADHPDQPFFLWSHYYDTHFRFDAHPDLPESNFGSDEQAMYDGEIRYSDHHIGRVLQALKELGQWDNTIIVVTSDHGDGFGEHGIPVAKRHGYHLYRTETKVPMIIRIPGVAGRVVQTPIGHVDILATLLNALRRPVTDEPQVLGQSLLGAMLGDDEAAGRRSIYQEVWYEGPTSKRAIATREAHLIRNLVPDDTTELFDLTNDAAEEHDLAGRGDAREATLLQRLAEVSDAIAIPLDFALRLKDARSAQPGQPQQALGDTLGDFVTVRGIDVAPSQLQPGQSAELTVHLAIRRAIPDGWVLFVHVIAAGGRSMNLDHAPLAGLVPLADLQPGTFVRDPIRVSLPVNWPVGATRVELGLYRKGARAPARGAHSAADAVTVATLEVTR